MIRKCERCQKEFDVPIYSNKLYCSSECRKKSKWSRQSKRRTNGNYNKEAICIICNAAFIAKYKKVKLCSKECVGIFLGNQRRKFLDIPSCLADASRKLDKNIGYVRVYVPMHPEANTRGYVYEHRVIAEQMIGRRLVKDEIVHHKNGKRWDNREENLEVMNKFDHGRMHGQREEDKDI